LIDFEYILSTCAVVHTRIEYYHTQYSRHGLNIFLTFECFTFTVHNKFQIRFGATVSMVRLTPGRVAAGSYGSSKRFRVHTTREYIRTGRSRVDARLLHSCHRSDTALVDIRPHSRVTSHQPRQPL